jgi:two-component system, OmpR family, sensor kinase
MIPRSLQARSVVAATAAILLSLVVVGIGVELVVARHLHRSLDGSLRTRAVGIAQLSASAPALLTVPGSLDTQTGTTHLSVEVVDRNGAIVARSLGMGGQVLDVGPQLSRALRAGESSYANVVAGGDPMRVYVAPLAELGGRAAGGAVVVGAATEDLNATLETLRLVLVVAGLLAALIGATAVAVLIRRALRPLGLVAEAAERIEQSGDARERLPEPVLEDEVGTLTRTLNAMLASLERARDAEREFLADASHELRTPLTALRGNIAYVARNGETPELISELEADADRLARLADDLLVLSREEAAARPSEVVRLDELAREAPVAHVSAPGPVSVLGDRAALERAVANLVENAKQYGPAGGGVTIDVAQENGRALLTVTDEGTGLQPYEADRAFRRFWRGSHAHPGSGLGLAIVAATAERHGGTAYARGPRFTIALPALSEPSETAATTEGESIAGGTS